MRGWNGLFTASVCVLLAACATGPGDEPDESAWLDDDNWTAANGEPECVSDVCEVLEMYQGCVDDNPVQEMDLAQAALVERQCDDDEGECCDQGFYISPEAAACISGNPGIPMLKYHLAYGAPIWEIADALISEIHAANGSMLSEREAPVAS